MPDHLLRTVDDKETQLSIGRTAVYELIAQGELESLKINRSRRIPTAAVEAYVERLREQARTEADTYRERDQ